MTWGSEVEVERSKRIRAAIAAYAYEFRDNSIMPDHDFDALCQSIDPMIDTGNEVMDAFFLTEFSASTGMWIRKHPQLAGIERIYKNIYEDRYVDDGSDLV